MHISAANLKLLFKTSLETNNHHHHQQKLPVTHLSATDRLCFPHQLEIPEERTRALLTLVTLVPLHWLQQQQREHHSHARMYRVRQKSRSTLKYYISHIFWSREKQGVLILQSRGMKIIYRSDILCVKNKEVPGCHNFHHLRMSTTLLTAKNSHL